MAPLVLIGTVILSFAAALGIGTFFFENVFDFPGIDPTLPLFAFIFLVALGIDYNIFLMARVREETLTHGTRDGHDSRPRGDRGCDHLGRDRARRHVRRARRSLPLVFLTEIGFTVAVGVLIDTLLVRSLLVPALVLEIGDRVWWPSALARTTGGRRREQPAGELAYERAGGD